MPELPDVEVFKEYLEKTSLKRKISDVEILNSKVLDNVSGAQLKKKLKGKTFASSERLGKYLVVHTDNAVDCVLHFGMTGFLNYHKDGEDEHRHTRVRFAFEDGSYLDFVNQRMLGRIFLAESGDTFAEEHGIGPDALSISEDQFAEALSSRSGALKPALMNQQLFSGVGNIYSDEILYQAKMNPEMRVGDVDHKQVHALFKAMRHVLEIAIKKNADPKSMPRTWLLPNRQEGAACPRCKGAIKKKKVSQRTAYYCPACQK